MTTTRLLALLLVASVLPLPVAAQVPADLTRALRAWDQAIAEEDSLTWEQFTAPNLMVVDDGGHLRTGAGHFTALRASRRGSLGSQQIIYIDGVRVTDGCTRESIDLRAKGTVATRRCLNDGTWWLEVWEKSAAGWKMVAAQGTAAAR